MKPGALLAHITGNNARIFILITIVQPYGLTIIELGRIVSVSLWDFLGDYLNRQSHKGDSHVRS